LHPHRAKQCHQVQPILRYSAAIRLSTPFVESVDNEGNKTQDDHHGNVGDSDLFHGQTHNQIAH